MVEIILFSTNCPQCKVLEKKLEQSGFNFTIEDDIREIMDAGFMQAPILKVDSMYYNFPAAIKWIKEQAGV